jgi:hypothetical protein
MDCNELSSAALEETKNMHDVYYAFIQRTGSYMFRQ